MSILIDDHLSGHEESTSEMMSMGGMWPQRMWYLPFKVSAEWLCTLVLLVLTAPMGLLIAIAIKTTSRGPVFYAQTRLGRNARVFRMYKFRTMVADAERHSGPVWAAKNDRRITPIGQVLRSTHLDELPQLFNILRGEMGLIGPRPERPELASRISRQLPEFRDRLAIRPGVTGLAQLLLPADDPNDAALLCVRRKLAHDLRYIRELGFMMDFRIALGTPCYFVAAAIDAVRRIMVSQYEIADDVVVGGASNMELHGGQAATVEAIC